MIQVVPRSVACRTVAPYGAHFGLCHRLSVGRYFEINAFIKFKLKLLIQLPMTYWIHGPHLQLRTLTIYEKVAFVKYTFPTHHFAFAPKKQIRR